MHFAFVQPNILGSALCWGPSVVSKCSGVRNFTASSRSELSNRVLKQETLGGKLPDLPLQSAFNVIIDQDEYRDTLLHQSNSCDLPILVFVPGLDGKPLPQCQAQTLSKRYVIVSLCHNPYDGSDWEQLVRAAMLVLVRLRESSREGLTMVGESFGAALALRLAAASPANALKRLVLLNSGTAILHDQLLYSAASLLPLLRIDGTERILYKAAAIILFRLLAREERLASSSMPKDGLPFLRSVDIDEVPLDAMLHRVNLLKSFQKTFTDDCIRDLVSTPTVLIASGRDLLLRSRAEIERLAKLLPHVESKIVLEESGHAALLEEGVSLSSILEPEHADDSDERNTYKPKKVLDDDFNAAFELGKQWFEPWRQLTSPKVLGKVNLQNALHQARPHGSGQRPVLLVGNHGVFGILDLSVLFIELKELLGDIHCRSLAHSSHFEQFGDISGGRWSKFVTDLGAVPASARNFYRLLSSAETILLFPGGAREVCRRRGERYRLFWKPEVDFVRPAAKFNAIIVPFSAVGADDSVDILIDGQELQRLPYVGPLVRRLLEDNKFSPEELMPIASFPPRADRFYFKFHEPIDTRLVDHHDSARCQSVYRRVREAVEGGLDDLFMEREKDPKRALHARIRDRILRSDRSSAGDQKHIGDFLRAILPTFDL